jgi:hypothetical protein
MSQQALEQDFSLRQYMDNLLHSDAARAIVMAGAVVLGAVGCGGSPGSEVRAQDPGTTIAAGDGTSLPLPQPGTTEVTQPPVTPATTARGPVTDAIRQVDFANFTFTATACENSAVTWPTNLVEGKASAVNGPDTVSVSILDAVGISYGDVNGDSIEEAIVPLKCEPGTNAITYPLNVYEMRGGQAQLLGVVGEAAGGKAQEILSALPKTVKVDNEKIVIDGRHYADNDRAFSPTEEATTTWSWNGSNFAMEGLEVHDTPTTATTKPEVNAGPFKVSINSVGPIHPGMSRKEITDLGFSFSPGCGQIEGINNGAIDLGVVIKDDKVAMIEVSDPNIHTLSGVGVGTTKEKLRATYKNLTFRQVNGAEVGIFKSAAPEDAADWLLFIVVEGKVKWMTLALDGQGLDNLEC